MCGFLTEPEVCKNLKFYAGKLFYSKYDILKAKCFLEFKSYFGDNAEKLTAEDLYFRSLSTELPQMFFTGERLKQTIAAEKCKYVSFDIFDTLIRRPFSNPDDIFYLLSSDFNKLVNSNAIIDFVYMRKYAEKHARDTKRKHGKDEVSLKEIYIEFGKIFGVSSDVCRQMYALEIAAELKMCEAKQSGYELYKFALYYEKKILFISDIYLSYEYIVKILKDNGYKNYYKLYISCYYDKCKYNGKLFEIVKKDLRLGKVELESLVHVGDNYSSDYKMAKSLGFNAYHINNAVSLFKGGNSAVYCGESFKNIYQKNMYFSAGKWDVEHYWGLRAFHGLVANQIFDYPFFAINHKSDFNADPRYIGYYCLGGLLLGLTRWLLSELKAKANCTIHFVARDGWLLKQFYDKYVEGLEGVPKSNYLYVSRKSLFVADISSKSDLLSILNNKIVVANASPRKIISLLKPLLTSAGYARINKYYQSKRTIDDVFGCNAAYLDFIKDFTDRFYTLLDFKSYRSKLVSYFSSIIKPGDVIFDVGYSGRTESILAKLLGFSIDSYYIHSNGEILDLREAKYGFRTKLFYNWRPNVTGVVREHLLMEYAASVQGYEFNEAGECKLIFGEFESSVQNKWFTDVIQKSALKFCDDFISKFGDYRDIFAVENYDLALPCEYYIQLAKPFDRGVFGALSFEDDVGVGGSVNVCDFWENKYMALTSNLLLLGTGSPRLNSANGQTKISNNDVMETMVQSLSLPKFPALKFKRDRKHTVLLYSNELSWSGAPRSLLRIAKVLLKNRYKVEVWSLFDGPLKTEYDKLNIAVKICDYKNADFNYAYNSFDLCIVNAAVSYKFYYVVSRYIPTVWYIREATNLVDIARGNPGLADVLQKSIDMVCVSDYAKQYITSAYNKNVSVVPNCVEDKYKGKIKTYNAKKVVFTTLGTIEPRKGYDIILEAVKSLPKSYAERIEYRIAGRVLDFCKDWANQLLATIKNTSNIKYLGEITKEEDLYEAYTQTDVVVVPSRDESCSLVALEGAMHAKPLIVTENTGAKYIVSDDNGYIVQTASARALADAIIKIMDKSAEEIYSMGKVSRTLYNEKASMEYYERCIVEMVEDKLNCPAINLTSPQTSKPVVPIIMATNQNYSPYVAVTIQSILENASKEYYYDIYVFYTELGKETVRKLEAAEADRYRVNTVNITSALNSKLKLRTCSHYTIETYYRFFAPEVLPFYDTLIYVDCDLVVLGDISELYKLDIGNCILGAVKNYMNRFVANYVENLHVSPEKYFNAGVLIINTKKFMEERIREKAFELLDKHEDFIMLDQDALNVVCKDQIYYLPEDWNVQWHHFEGACDIVINKQACIDAYSAPKILHFTGKNKPWKDARIPKADLFWKYAEKTKFSQEIIKNLSAANVVSVVNFDAPQQSKPIQKQILHRVSKGLLTKIKRFFEVWEEEGLKVSIKRAFQVVLKRK